jgi:ACS family tartrate transporter-like MFS transporter
MMVWGLISSCMIFVRAPWHLYVLRFLLGSAEAGFFPGIVFYLKGWFPSTTRARTVALFAAAGAISAVIAGPLSGTLLRLHQAGLAGWQWMFFLEGIPAILLGLGVLLYLTNTPSEANWLSVDERTWLIDELAQESSGSYSLALRGGPKEVFSNPQIWLLVFIYFGLNCAGYGITFWLPSLIRSLSGVGTITIGLLTAIPYAAAFIVMIVAGAHADKSGEHRWHIAFPAFLGAIALLSAGYSSSVRGLVAALSIAVVAQFSIVGPFWAISTMVKPRHAAAGIALINSIGNLGGLAGSYVVGALKNTTSGFRDGILVLGVALGTAGVLALWLRTEANYLRNREQAAGQIAS